MRFAIFGAGGVGGYFGGRLQDAGEDVAFVARGAHLEALRTTGLRIESPLGELHLTSVEAHDDPKAIGPVDVVLLAVKTWQLDDALAQIEPLLGEDTCVVPLLNGVEAAARTAERIGAERVLGGTCKIISHLGAPGTIVHVGSTPWIGFGELDGTIRPRGEALKAALKNAGVAARLSDAIESLVWDKLVFVASVGGVGAMCRVPIGAFRDVEPTRRTMHAAMLEIVEVARARGVDLDASAAERAMQFVDALPYEGTSSLQRDIAAGRRSELDAWTGAVVRLGRAAGVATPVNDVVYAALLPLERAATEAAPATR
ncbi:MAG: 2-dehydropantoate 2-reductase [Deltaproteobacteria bacterium]|jgi:2-dehydropantoate 2-reductase